jgi:DNA-directed RNA polymerase subunit K/omega
MIFPAGGDPMDSEAMDNKFKFITVAAARCNQLQRGARPKVDIEFRAPEDLNEESSGTDPLTRGQDAG